MLKNAPSKLDGFIWLHLYTLAWNAPPLKWKYMVAWNHVACFRFGGQLRFWGGISWNALLNLKCPPPKLYGFKWLDIFIHWCEMPPSQLKIYGFMKASSLFQTLVGGAFQMYGSTVYIYLPTIFYFKALKQTRSIVIATHCTLLLNKYTVIYEG